MTSLLKAHTQSRPANRTDPYRTVTAMQQTALRAKRSLVALVLLSSSSLRITARLSLLQVLTLL
jgi:hypothetical protein